MAGTTNTESFIDEDFLRRLENLRILANRGIKGLGKGEHISWRSGPSLEFLDYRKYQIGDDFRYVDWNVYGRLDKLFIKLFRAEENQNIHILIDSSRSMEFGKPLKDTYAKKIAAAISFIGLTHMDNLYVTAFRNQLDDSMAPVKSRLAYSRVLNYLHALQPRGKTDVNACLVKYAGTHSGPAISIILSDLMDQKGFEEGLEALQHARFDIAVIQILDREEILPINTGSHILKEIEVGEKMNITIDRSTLTLYHRKMQDFLEYIKKYCLDKGIDYYLCNTSIPFEDLLLDYLTSGRLFRRYGSHW